MSMVHCSSFLSPTRFLRVALFVTALTWQLSLSQNLLAIYPDVEQGSATLIVSPSGNAVLIDAGSEIFPTDNDVSQFLQDLLQRGIFNRLIATLSTHYNEDHIGSMDRVLDSGIMPPNGLVYDRGDFPQATMTRAYEDYLDAAQGFTRRTASPGEVIDLGGGASLEFIVVNGVLSDGSIIDVSGSPQLENSLAIAIVVRYGGFDLWIGGDLTGNAANGLPDVETPAGTLAGDVDVYTVNHHGSQNTSSVQTFLDQITPEVAICQNGTGNTFGHPNSIAVRRILRFGDFFANNPGPASDERIDNSLASGFSDPDGLGGIAGAIHIATDGTQYVVAGEDFKAQLRSVDSVPQGFPSGNLPPLISNVSQSSVLLQPSDQLGIEADVIDPDVTQVEIEYAVDGVDQAPVAMNAISSDRFSAELPPQPAGSRIVFRVRAQDGAGQEAFSAERQASVGFQGAGDGLIISEVFYDHSGSDNGKEWVELFNSSDQAINLSNFSLGNGGNNYTVSKAQLSGVIGPRQFFVVGGPDKTAENGRPTYNQIFNFSPDLQNAASGGTADGVALFNRRSSQVTSTTVPIDAVIYGGVNDSGLIDQTGLAPAPHVNDVSPGRAIQRTSIAGTWGGTSNPNPGSSPFFPTNAKPTADAGADQMVDEGTTIVLNGGASSDLDGDALTFLWEQMAGPTVTLTNADSAQATFAAPDVAQDTVLTFRLTVNDGQGGTDSDAVDITVRHVLANIPPNVEAGPDQVVSPGKTVTLAGSAAYRSFCNF